MLLLSFETFQTITHSSPLHLVHYDWTRYVILEYVFFVQNSKQGVRCHNVADAGRVKQPFVRQIAFMYLNTLVVDENLQMHLHICTTTVPSKLYIFRNTTALSFLLESNAIQMGKVTP